jgi:hypothetical protein
MIKINDKEYDEKDLSEQAKIAFVNVQNLQKDNTALSLKMNNNNILIKHWSEILEKELPKKDD